MFDISPTEVLSELTEPSSELRHPSHCPSLFPDVLVFKNEVDPNLRAAHLRRYKLASGDACTEKRTLTPGSCIACIAGGH